MTRVPRTSQCGTSPAATRAEAIALALMGAGEMPAVRLAENAVWDAPSGAIMGRAAIMAARAAAPPPDKIELDEITTKGKAGSVSGRVFRAGAASLFCHLIRYTNASGVEIAQLVSFEHSGTPR